MNMTSFNYTDRPPYPFNTSASNVVRAILVALLILLNLSGNIMVCACFYSNRSLRTLCNYFIVSLSLADICIALFAMPFWLVIQLTNNQLGDVKLVLSDQVYTFWSCMDILVGTASITNLVAVSFDRQLAITAPFTYPKVFTHARVIALICALWVYSIAITLVRGFADPKFLQQYYTLMVVILSFFIPFMVMFVMYAKIYHVARSQARRIGGNFAHDLKAAKTIAIVIGTFLVCWGPFFLYNFSTYLFFCCKLKYDIKVMVPAIQCVKWLHYLNSCLNPIIYTCLNRTYRTAFLKLMRSCCSKGNLDEGSFRSSSSTQKKNSEKTEFITRDSDSSENVRKNGKMSSIVEMLRRHRDERKV
ncbi:predicted protein [Nematostella vectensis]|uniref:G-protein coupled receptors family 1 profile domain-containing protein n=1 Tax=Nematostella vectensis TaxID=45351 RepID=A7RLJ5_NEMVE|nr:dopamine D2-like receptor [Nematostella vectensis]XP_032220614.1 dopamine D2-like receptor [Nematostella vectensis]XP_032220615.1 dopamine D2-like receptor [Nematostella vectensis]XP_032220616.1 dopamine D2-like receptor [Nematostella vectensis]XP_032220617.1 dopamine D2-like receptor [Nematostella vectensis]XP_032220618.1 dopamine D2-like receptor [Nematostella vectensis]XP_032220619.1 dopamine D2-like receptor [Nematostella vectensis]XP_032220620.1 dopamine D2-like receptor [Nematostell|eukprot:XP_001639765.1 predicted protein [Nematostella vectensis]